MNTIQFKYIFALRASAVRSCMIQVAAAECLPRDAAKIAMRTKQPNENVGQTIRVALAKQSRGAGKKLLFKKMQNCVSKST